VTNGNPTAGGTSAGGSPATGKPINLVFLTQVSSQGTGGDGWPGIQAAIKYVNAHGGIKGRPLAAQECVDNADPNLAVGCATRAAGDPSVIASVGSATLQGAAVDPILERAGLPAIGVNAYVSADFNSPVVFATDIGGLLPPLSFGKPGTALGGQAPRIVNPTMGLAQYQNGTFVPVAGGKFVNPFVIP
jgi:Periplasmic binding protein